MEGMAATQDDGPSVRADYTRDEPGGKWDASAESRAGRSGVPRRSLRLLNGGRTLPHYVLATAELSEEFLHRSRQRRLVQTVDHVLTLTLVHHKLRLFQD